MRTRLILLLLCAGLMLGSAVFLLAQETAPEAAVIVNDEGGPVRVSGELPLANPLIKISTVDPVIILEDQGGFVDRDLEYTIPLESQVLARFTGDFYAEGNVGYELDLPVEPQGSPRDVDQDGEADAGVQIFQIAHWDNRYGDLFLDHRDAFGWSGAYSSARVSNNPKLIGEITGGIFIVYAPDDQQGFPSGFGKDELLFTADDPIVLLPQGYTLVDMETDPFTFDRSRYPVVDLLEPEELVPDDFSAMSYTEAFDALVEKGRNEYAFTDYKGIDWDALVAEFRPRFEEAEKNADVEAYLIALNDFSLAFHDGHMATPSQITEALEQESIAGGLGFAIRELSDGRILVIFVMEDSPAAEAGMLFGAEVSAIGGLPIQEAIAATVAVNAPYGVAENERLDQVRFVTRAPLETEVEVTFKNPDASEDTTVTMTTIDERDSLLFSRQFLYAPVGSELESPLEFHFLDSGYGYAEVNDFLGNETLLIENWEFFLNLANLSGAPGIIIDLRTNGGGFSTIGNRMASYLYDEAFDLYYSEDYNKEVDAFYYDPRFPNRIEPEEDLSKRYRGKVAVLVGPSCASACEYFAYALTRQNRSIVVGLNGTSGAGGGWSDTYMPEGVIFVLPTSRKIDLDGNVIIEGIGIQPTIRVPVTEENMISTDDLVLEAAITALDEANAVTIQDEGEIAVGDTVTGEILAATNVRYTLVVTEGQVIDISLTTDKADLDVVLSLYLDDGETLAAQADSGGGGETEVLEDLEIPQDLTLIVEVSGFEGGTGPYTLSISDAGAEATAEATANP